MADRGEVGVTKVQITWEGKNIVRYTKQKNIFHQFSKPFIYTNKINVWEITKHPPSLKQEILPWKSI